jgi:type IX secretion system PorP/SprF family membrane protein
MIRLVGCIIAGEFTLLECFAQDPGYSQFYANPLYLNPGLTGFSSCSRVRLNYRNQWPSLSGQFVQYSASFDTYFKPVSSGVGIMVNVDDAGNGILRHTRISGFYSFRLKLNRKMNLNTGFEGSYFNQHLSWDRLIFPDMIDQQTGSLSQSSSYEPQPDYDNKSVADFSAGTFFDYGEKYYAGAAFHHLTQPLLGYYENSTHDELKLKMTLHAGCVFNHGKYKNSEKPEWQISPNILYQRQGNAEQLNLGLYVTRYPVTLGIWHRNNMTNADAVIFLIGIEQDRYGFGYSYDLTLSRLRNLSGGAHEASFAWYFNCHKKSSFRKTIRCPEF